MLGLPMLLLALTGCTSTAGERVSLTIEGRVFSVEVANTPEKRRVGLMNREELAADAGMLFVFPEDRTLSFWMKDTLIPLSIAFISSDGTIRQIEEMEPLSLRSVESDRAVRYALEVNQGAFERYGISVGDRVEIPEEIRRAID
jgi:hypothetical protein